MPKDMLIACISKEYTVLYKLFVIRDRANSIGRLLAKPELQVNLDQLQSIHANISVQGANEKRIFASHFYILDELRPTYIEVTRTCNIASQINLCNIHVRHSLTMLKRHMLKQL